MFGGADDVPASARVRVPPGADVLHRAPMVEGGPTAGATARPSVRVSPDCPAKHAAQRRLSIPRSRVRLLPGLCDSTSPLPAQTIWPAIFRQALLSRAWTKAIDAPHMRRPRSGVRRSVHRCLSLPNGGVWCTQTCDNRPGKAAPLVKVAFGSAEIDLPIGHFARGLYFRQRCPSGVPCESSPSCVLLLALHISCGGKVVFVGDDDGVPDLMVLPGRTLGFRSVQASSTDSSAHPSAMLVEGRLAHDFLHPLCVEETPSGGPVGSFCMRTLYSRTVQRGGTLPHGWTCPVNP